MNKKYNDFFVLNMLLYNKLYKIEKITKLSLFYNSLTINNVLKFITTIIIESEFTHHDTISFAS